MKWAIYERYQYISKEGKVFTHWFRTGDLYSNEESAKENIKCYKLFSKDFDRITKLKHEYEARYIDETLLPQLRLRRPKGRPKKITDDVVDTILGKLYKSKTESVKLDLITAKYLYNDEINTNYIKDAITKKYNGIKTPVFWYEEKKGEITPYILLKNTADVNNDNNR